MSIDATEVLKIAHLARLNIDEQAIPRYTRDLQDILNLVQQMNQLDTTGIEPMAHPVPTTQPKQADLVTEPNQRELFQSIAPRVEAGLYIVPKVIGEE